MTPETFLKARKMLVRDEDERQLAYDDKTSRTLSVLPSGGKVTVGIGRNCSDVPFSREEIDLMLANDLKRARETCVSIFGEKLWVSWSENRQLGWLNFAFNLGYARMRGFSNTLKFAIAQDWGKVEEHLKASLWFKQVGQRAPRVIAMICREEWPYA